MVGGEVAGGLGGGQGGGGVRNKKKWCTRTCIYMQASGKEPRG